MEYFVVGQTEVLYPLNTLKINLLHSKSKLLKISKFSLSKTPFSQKNGSDNLYLKLKNIKN